VNKKIKEKSRANYYMHRPMVSHTFPSPHPKEKRKEMKRIIIRYSSQLKIKAAKKRVPPQNP